MKSPTFNIRDRRKELKLTLEEVGRHVGVSKGTVSKWENGNIKNMRSDKIYLLAEILGVSIMDILSVCEKDQDVVLPDSYLDEPDEDDPDFIHPEDKAAMRRNRFNDSIEENYDEEPFPKPEKLCEPEMHEIAYRNEFGEVIRQKLSKKQFDLIMTTIKMLKDM